MKHKKIKILSIMVIFLFSIFVSPSFAFFGDKEEHVYRTFYVPFMPKAEKVHGAYRLITHSGDCNISIFKGRISYKTGDISGDKAVTDVLQTINLVRSDLVVLTRLGLKVSQEKKEGNTVYHDTVYYETPEYIIGYFADLSPLTGSSIIQAQGRPYFVASKISDLTKIFTGIQESEILKSLVNYQGAEPKGKWIPIGKEEYIVSQNPDRILLDWWQELSQEFLADNLRNVQSFEWQEISDYYEETAFVNGRVSSIPCYRTGLNDISNDKMISLWSSKKGVLGKSNLPDHFTDYMTSVSPGTWVSSGKTFISYDPNLLVRWLYEIPVKEGAFEIKISTNIPTDFSPLKVDKEIYHYAAICGDPNMFFAFAPFDDKAFDEKSGVKVFFPYTKRYQDSRYVKRGLGETKESLASLPEDIRSAITTVGSGDFEGDTETHLYGIGACFFVPADKDGAIKMLNSKGFGNAVKSLGISSESKGSYGTFGSSLREWK